VGRWRCIKAFAARRHAPRPRDLQVCPFTRAATLPCSK